MDGKGGRRERSHEEARAREGRKTDWTQRPNLLPNLLIEGRWARTGPIQACFTGCRARARIGFGYQSRYLARIVARPRHRVNPNHQLFDE
jgi:hypothetical protein